MRDIQRYCVVLLAVVIVCSGCGARPITGSWFRHERSYDYVGETVTIKLLSRNDLESYINVNYGGDSPLKEEWKNRLNDDFPSLFPRSGSESAIAALAPIAIGFAIDAVKGELQKEASLYEAQFGATVHETGFWKEFKYDAVLDNWVGEPQWLGFEVVRRTAEDGDNSKSAASRIVFAMIPANLYKNRQTATTAGTLLTVIKPQRSDVFSIVLTDENGARGSVSVEATNESSEDLSRGLVNAINQSGDNVVKVFKAEQVGASLRVSPKMAGKSYKVAAETINGTNQGNKNEQALVLPVRADERLFMVKPLLVDVQRSRAKVFATGSKIDLRAIVRLEATWIDGGQNVRNDVVASGDFEFKSLDLNGRLMKVGDKEHEVRAHIDTLKDKLAGWFGGVPVSVDFKTKQPKGNGTFRLSVAVTESDQSQAREVVERAAKYLGENREEIVKKFGGEQ